MDYDYDAGFRDALNKGLDDIVENLTPEQIAEIEKAGLEVFGERISAAVTQAIHESAKSMAETLKRTARPMLEDRRARREEFEWHLAEHWGRAFDLTEMVMKVAYEAGEFFHEKHSPQASENRDLVFAALARLQARACRIAEEVLVLIKAGYGQAAHTRWRALHEVAVVADFIAHAGADTAERYFAHEVVESWRAMAEFQLHAEELDDTPYSAEEELSARRAFEAGVAKYGPKFAGPHGWAHAALSARDPRYVKERTVTLAAIEESVGAAHMRPYYRMASHAAHANPKGITFTPDLLREERGAVLLTGASPAGLADPGQSLVITLTWMTATVLASKLGEATGLIIGAMGHLRDEACKAYIEAHQALEERKPAVRGRNGSESSTGS